MFVDILGRIKQWTGNVQSKLDSCKNEVNNLSRELLARLCEIDAKTREVADLKAQFIDYQNGLLLNGRAPIGVPISDRDRIEKIRSKRDEFPEINMHENQVEPITEDSRIETAKEIKRAKAIAIKNEVRTVDRKSEEEARAADQRMKKDAKAIKDAKDVKDAKDKKETPVAIRKDKERERFDKKYKENEIDEEIRKDEDKEDEEESEEEDEKSLRKKDDKRRRKHLAVQTNMQWRDRMKRESEVAF